MKNSKTSKLVALFLALAMVFGVNMFTIVSAAQPVYRALCIGNDHYQPYNKDLNGCINDATHVKEILQTNIFDDGQGFSKIDFVTDATRSVALSAIASAFAGATADDVSYFYYAGHGSNDNGKSWLCTIGNGTSGWVSVDELEVALSAIPGTVVVILDSCFSGGFINAAPGEQGPSEEELEEQVAEFNDNVISVFDTASRAYLTSQKYHVITACSKTQLSYEDDINPPFQGMTSGNFTSRLSNGCGHPKASTLAADTNNDKKITQTEAYNYTRQISGQTVKSYPTSSDFVMFQYQAAPVVTYAVNFSVIGGNGVLSASVDGADISSGASVARYKNVRFEANPASGYQVKEWKDNNVVIKYNGDVILTNVVYTVPGILEAHTVTVEFEAIPPAFTYGDLNDDGSVNMSDLFILARHIANWPGYEASTFNMLAADVNADGKVNMPDLFILARYIAKWPGYDLPYTD